MDLDKLTEIITDEVTRYLQGSESEQSCDCPAPAVNGTSVQDGVSQTPPPAPTQPSPQHVKTNTPAFTHKILCLIHGEIEREMDFNTALSNWPMDGVGVEALITDKVDRGTLERKGVRILSSMAELGIRNENLKNYKAVIIPSLDRTLAAKIALGIADEEIIEVVFSALFYQGPVFGAQERLLPNSQTDHGNNLPGMANKIAEYRADLERMGLEIAPTKEILSRVIHSAKVATPGAREVITQLITLDDAKNLPGPVVRVARGGLVTSMARDLLSQRGIEIEIAELDR